MAVTVRKHPHSPFWQAVVKTEDGRRTNRTTKIRITDPRSREKAKERGIEIQLQIHGDADI